MPPITNLSLPEKPRKWSGHGAPQEKTPDTFIFFPRVSWRARREVRFVARRLILKV